MIIPDHGRAEHYLSHLNYYRLGAYWLPFELDHATHQLEPNTNFDQVLDLYIFDRELRLLVMDAIERFEVSLRTQWAYHLAHKYGAHAYLDQQIFRDLKRYNQSKSKLLIEIKRSHETFIEHYKRTYTSPEHPPIWAVVEVMSYGLLSMLFGNLKHRFDRNRVVNIYQLDERIVVSLMHHLTMVRNICAHHGRLWNRKFTITFARPKNGPNDLLQSLSSANTRNLYNSLVMLEYLVEVISPDSRWGEHLVELLEKHGAVDVGFMGFPSNWKQRPIWHRHLASK